MKLDETVVYLDKYLLSLVQHAEWEERLGARACPAQTWLKQNRARARSWDILLYCLGSTLHFGTAVLRGTSSQRMPRIPVCIVT